MKNLKFIIIAFGVLGLISLVMLDIFKGLDRDAAQAILLIAAFAVPVIVSVVGITKPPAQAWQAAAALAGFVLAFVKFRVWEMVKVLSLLPMGYKLGMVAAVGGIVVSILALVKPEAKA